MVGQLSPIAFCSEMAVSVGMERAVHVIQLKHHNISDISKSLLSRKQQSWAAQRARWAANLVRPSSTRRAKFILWMVTRDILQISKLGPVLFILFVGDVYNDTERRSQKTASLMRRSG